ncbi:MAG: hypothetical protein WC405_19285 [Syntrophales bacterium]
MLSLVFLLVLGWLLYKAFFPDWAPYHGKVPTEHKDLQCNHRGLIGHCQEDEHLLGDLSLDLENNGLRLFPLLDEDYGEQRRRDDLFGSHDPCHHDYWSKSTDPFG